MFTGIVNDVGEVIKVENYADDLRRITIAADFPPGSLAIGASVACAGCCLTVVGLGDEPGLFDVDAAAETLEKTHIKEWMHGTHINLERALKVGDELGGHFVSGHVDGLAECIARENLTDSARMTFRAPKELMRFIAPKGSVALDGVSLTVNEVTADTFSVLIIPHTMSVTTLGAAKAGDAMNLEIDLMARYAARLMETK